MWTNEASPSNDVSNFVPTELPVPHFCPAVHDASLSRRRRIGRGDATKRIKGSSERSRGPRAVAALLSATKELTKHDNHNGHKSHNWCGGGAGKPLSELEIRVELNKYYFDDRPTWRAWSSVIRPRNCPLIAKSRKNYADGAKVAYRQRSKAIWMLTIEAR